MTLKLAKETCRLKIIQTDEGRDNDTHGQWYSSTTALPMNDDDVNANNNNLIIIKENYAVYHDDTKDIHNDGTLSKMSSMVNNDIND